MVFIQNLYAEGRKRKVPNVPFASCFRYETPGAVGIVSTVFRPFLLDCTSGAAWAGRHPSRVR